MIFDDLCGLSQGDIATCAGTFLHVWTVNGEEIASINTATSRNQQILCVSMSQMMEWDVRNVIMTGNSDGVVRVSILRNSQIFGFFSIYILVCRSSSSGLISSVLSDIWFLKNIFKCVLLAFWD